MAVNLSGLEYMNPPVKQMKRYFKWIVLGGIAVFALLQLTNPARTNPPVVQDFVAADSPPPEVAALLHAACYDCHSHATRWPWYSKVAPMSWLIASDVTGGRKHINLSNWPTSEPERAVRWLDNMSEEIGNKEMPPKKYTTIHADARLSDGQRKQLSDWLDAESARLTSVSGKTPIRVDTK
jgi:hypothetical protein